VATLRPSVLVVSALLLLSLALPAHAGSAAAPEVTDPSDDESAAGTVPIVQPPAGTTVGLNVDILAGWVETLGSAVQFTIKVHGPGTPTSTSSYLYTFHFETGGQAYDATGLLDIASPGGTGGITPGGAATTAVAAGDSLIVLGVPLSGIGSPAPGAVLSNLFVTAEGKVGGKASGSITDRAPDTGAGATYALAGGAAKTVHATLDGPRLAVAQAFVNATTATYLYNWTQGPANATLALPVHAAAGNVSVEVRDAANKTVFQHTVSGSADYDGRANITGAAPGKWTVRIAYAAFKGNLTLGIEPRAPLVPIGGNTSSKGSSSSGSSTSSSTSKGTPAAGTALLLTGLGVSLAARRRRT
jgi:hypothetical protein